MPISADLTMIARNRSRSALSERACPAQPPPTTHNGGPPLDDQVPPWGNNGIGNYFDWKRAHQKAWKTVSTGTVLRRLKLAEACGLTYEEYTRVLLDTGRYLEPADTELIAKIIARR